MVTAVAAALAAAAAAVLRTRPGQLDKGGLRKVHCNACVSMRASSPMASTHSALVSCTALASNQVDKKTNWPSTGTVSCSAAPAWTTPPLTMPAAAAARCQWQPLSCCHHTVGTNASWQPEPGAHNGA
jgi:hypothetical protein